jgi:propionate CoA-transferase
MNKLMTAADAAVLIADGATVAITGSGGGLLEPDALLAAIERRFLETGKPQGLTVVHAQGLGDGSHRGLNHLAHENLVARVIGAHWSWSPKMQALAAEEKIEAYALPGGVIQHLIRETGAGRPGLFTTVGIGTVVDPRMRGGRMNARTTRAVSEIVTVDGREFIRYKPLKIDVALLRGSVADDAGNVSLQDEGAELDALTLAMAAHNNRGSVIVQVKRTVGNGGLMARSVRLPGALTDAIIVSPDQPQSHAKEILSGLSGCERSNPEVGDPGVPPSSIERRIIGTRAADELRDGAIVSFGFGIPDEVAAVAAQDGRLARCHQTLDHGHYGGKPLKGDLFGFVRNGEALIDSPSQFDFYSGGGVDIAFLGFGQFDRAGNVNVSRLQGAIVGPGGFIDISQGARKVVFCGTFEAKGLEIEWAQGSVRIVKPGAIAKLVPVVDEVTFSAARAVSQGQEVLYVTERAVFALTSAGVVLQEIAQGIDLDRDILSRMQFAPLMDRGSLRTMRLAIP